MWPDRRLIELFGVELPIVQAPVAGAMDWELTVAAALKLLRGLADAKG